MQTQMLIGADLAAGTETEEQILFLRGEDCAELQGYAIGRPTPVDGLTEWTTATRSVATDPPRKAKRSA